MLACILTLYCNKSNVSFSNKFKSPTLKVGNTLRKSTFHTAWSSQTLEARINEDRIILLQFEEQIVTLVVPKILSIYAKHKIPHSTGNFSALKIALKNL